MIGEIRLISWAILFICALRRSRAKKLNFLKIIIQGEYIIDLARELLVAPEAGVAARFIAPTTPEDCREYGVKRILEIIRTELKDFGVRFDSWFSQTELEKSGNIDTVISFLKEKGFIYQQEGATWFSSTKFGDDKDRVVVKSDGSYTYLAPDIAYHQDKFKRGYDWLINL